MSIQAHYFNYLAHFGETCKLVDFAKRSGPAIALRHDVDHCIDTALEMSFWEYESGIKATYFILDTAPYSEDPRLLDKCRQMQAFGHEIGIHNNVLTQWHQDKYDPGESLEKQIRRFRDAGIKIFGTSTHGDPGCYSGHYINYWVFSELRTEQPELREISLNAEGIPEPNADKRITYPREHQIKSSDGRQFPLWSVSQNKLRLLYEASHLEVDAYFTDSGGSWSRSPDPLAERLTDQRIQILMHPIHWRAPRRIYFFLSTKCSGSRALTRILDQASSCTSHHQTTSRHDNRCSSNDAFQAPAYSDTNQPIQSRERPLDAFRQFADQQEADCFATSENLSGATQALVEKFPDACFVLLYRQPGDIVHAISRSNGMDDFIADNAAACQQALPETLSDFEKCCTYVGIALHKLLRFCSFRLSYERLVADQTYRLARLQEMGIAYYPLLGDKLVKKAIISEPLKRMNFLVKRRYAANKVFHNQLADLAQQFNAEDRCHGRSPRISRIFGIDAPRGHSPLTGDRQDTILLRSKIDETGGKDFFVKNGAINLSENKLQFSVQDSKSHAYVMLNGGEWDSLTSAAGWSIRHLGYYTWTIKAVVPKSLNIKLFCLYYDEGRQLIQKRSMGGVGVGAVSRKVCFTAIGNARYFNLAIYAPRQNSRVRMQLKEYSLKFLAY